jgi:hypothetical protein
MGERSRKTTMARLLGRLDGESRTALRTDFAIYMAENA